MATIEKTTRQKLNEIRQIVPASKSLLSNESYCWYPAKEVDKIIEELENRIDWLINKNISDTTENMRK